MGGGVDIVKRAVASGEMVLGRMVPSWEVCVEAIARDVGRRRERRNGIHRCGGRAIVRMDIQRWRVFKVRLIQRDRRRGIVGECRPELRRFSGLATWTRGVRGRGAVKEIVKANNGPTIELGVGDPLANHGAAARAKNTGRDGGGRRAEDRARNEIKAKSRRAARGFLSWGDVSTARRKSFRPGFLLRPAGAQDTNRRAMKTTMRCKRRYRRPGTGARHGAGFCSHFRCLPFSLQPWLEHHRQCAWFR